jgi:hypothetical protein
MAGMERRSTFAPLVAALIGLPLILSVAYVVGYFWLCKDLTISNRIGPKYRVYQSRVFAGIFSPAAMAESWITGRETDTMTWPPSTSPQPPFNFQDP